MGIRGSENIIFIKKVKKKKIKQMVVINSYGIGLLGMAIEMPLN